MPTGDICKAIDVDGEPVLFRGTDEPLSDRAREALGHVVRATRRKFEADHADDPPALETVAEAVHAQGMERELLGSDIAREAGVKLSTVVRLMQNSTTLTVAELAALARWAGLEIVAKPVA